MGKRELFPNLDVLVQKWIQLDDGRSGRDQGGVSVLALQYRVCYVTFAKEGMSQYSMDSKPTA